MQNITEIVTNFNTQFPEGVTPEEEKEITSKVENIDIEKFDSIAMLFMNPVVLDPNNKRGKMKQIRLSCTKPDLIDAIEKSLQ